MINIHYGKRLVMRKNHYILLFYDFLNYIRLRRAAVAVIRRRFAG